MQRTRRAIYSPRGQLTISLSGPAACMCRHSNSARAGSGLDHSSNKEDEMTSNVVETRLLRSNTSRLSNEAERPTAATDQFSRAKQLAQLLLSERGEASGALLARELHGVLRSLDAGDRQGFQRYLATKFHPDTAGGAGGPRAGRRSAPAGTAAADEHGARWHRHTDRDAQRDHRAFAPRAGTEAARCRPQASVRILVQPRLSRTAADGLAVAGGGAGEADRL